jgi:ankyrin repeat protein
MKTEFDAATKLPAPDEAEIKKFHEDIRFGRTADFQTFLDKFGAGGVEAKLPDGGTSPLMNAAWWGRPDMAKELLDRGANIEARDDKGHTALMAAAWRNQIAVVRLLLNHGADIEARNEKGITALIFSTYDDGMESVRELLSRGANADAISDCRWTPMIQAMVNGKTDVAYALFNHGADIHVTDLKGKSAIEYARENNHPETALALESATQGREEAYNENEVRIFGEYATKGAPAPIAVAAPLRFKGIRS